MDKPDKLDIFMYALMKEAKRNSLMDFIEAWEISEDEYKEIRSYFIHQLDILL